MTREDAIRKIKALRNPNGRTEAEAKMFRAKADQIQADQGIQEYELLDSPFDLTAFRQTRSPEATEAIRKAQEAMDAAARARAQARWEDLRRARNEWRPPKARKAPRRGAFAGEVPFGKVHPDRWQALMDELGIRTKGDLAFRCGVSQSLVSEWFGKGRGRFCDEWQFDYYADRARAYGKGS